jgi:alanine racemase
VLILSPLTRDECDTAVANGFSCSVSSKDEINLFGAVAESLGKVAKVHAVADTGMGRMGASKLDWHPMLTAIQEHPRCDLEGVATHFPNADEDTVFTKNQIETFREMSRELGCDVHLANSAGLIDFSGDLDYATLVRPGLALYGVAPECKTRIELRPALEMKSRVTLVREIDAGTTISYGSTFTSDRPMKVASIAVGYGDGYPRHLSGNDVDVLVAGQRCRLLGRVTMDQIVVDVSHVETAAPGDEVVLIGKQGNEFISATEIATKSGTIAWEILTGLTHRAERVYL